MIKNGNRLAWFFFLLFCFICLGWDPGPRNLGSVNDPSMWSRFLCVLLSSKSLLGWQFVFQKGNFAIGTGPESCLSSSVKCPSESVVAGFQSVCGGGPPGGLCPNDPCYLRSLGVRCRIGCLTWRVFSSGDIEVSSGHPSVSSLPTFCQSCGSACGIS